MRISIFTCLIVVFWPFYAAFSTENSQTLCQVGGQNFVEGVREKVLSMGRETRFETNLIKGGRTVPLHIRGAQPNLLYRVVAVRGRPGQAEHERKNVQKPLIAKDKTKFIEVLITGIDLQETGSGEAQTILQIQVPEMGLFWPTVTFYVAACPALREGFLSGSGPEPFVALAQAHVSAYGTCLFLSLTVVVLVYVLAAAGVRKARNPPVSFWKALNPFRLTSGIFGKSSISNLQIFVFTLIIMGLLVYVLLRTGLLSDISANVAWLLGIVGVGTGAARLSANSRQPIQPANLSWLLKSGWVTREPSISQLVTEGGEFSVTRFQGIAFSLVVAIALLISGPSDLSGFTIPDTILGLLVASQAIYVGGKWVRPGSNGEKDLMKTINQAIAEAREAADELIKQVPAGTPRDQLVAKAKQMNAYQVYKQKAAKAGNLIAAYFGVPMPETGLFGIPLV